MDDAMAVDDPDRSPPSPQPAAADDSVWGEGDDVEGEVEADGEHARPRKRTRRACDKCSTSRTRCDGSLPCRRCEDYGYTCRYNREIKKRGRVPSSAVGRGTLVGGEELGRRNLKQGQINNGGGDTSPSSSAVTSPPEMPSVLATASQQQLPVLEPPPPPPPSQQHRERDAPATSSSRPQRHVSVGSVTSLSATGPGLPPTPGAYPLPSPGGFGATTTYLQLAPLLLDPALGGASELRRPQDSPGQLAAASDESAGYTSPANGVSNHTHTHIQQHHHLQQQHHPQHHVPFSAPPLPQRTPSSSTSNPDPLPSSHPQTYPSHSSLYRAPSADCRYACLAPVLPHLTDIVPASVACDLLDVYLTEPGSSLFRCASPYVLTRIFRRRRLLHTTHPRPCTPALLATMLWCAAQTADIVLLHVPGSRARIANALYALATALVAERDPDRWRRSHGGLRAERDGLPGAARRPATTATNEPGGVVDDVLTFVLLSIAVSGGDFKSDCFKWWSKAVRLALALGLNREDERCGASVSPCANPLCGCRREDEPGLASAEFREERRRVFWLLYCLDRHLALSFNNVLYLPDSYCEVYAPLPEAVWENLDAISPEDLPQRHLGPPTAVSGTGFFEYFLPLMAILGDIIEIHHRRWHPRLGSLDDSAAVAAVSELLAACERSLAVLVHEPPTATAAAAVTSPGPHIRDLLATTGPGTEASAASRPGSGGREALVAAYAAHIVHVLHVLLHGKWDAISMLDDGDDGGADDWITSARFAECAAHAIAASSAVSRILASDPELTFMPYLFGIYLLHGSFILLLFADRMPQLGPNPSVEQACETIIRAHEVCVVTLSTEFQRNFRKVLRSTLYSVRGSSPTDWEEHKARRRALSLYRWTKGAKGLAL